MVSLDYLDRKAIPTWRVTRDKDEWFFTEKNGPVFDPPHKRAERLYKRLIEESSICVG